ncbi:AAA family ATPase [bacterium]|nr:AAA family ATPase [bacterium]
MPMIMVLNLKGGVAKTTNAVAMAEGYAYLKKKVLLIDADHQSTASELLLGETQLAQAEKQKRTLHDLLAAMLAESFNPKQIPKMITPRASRIQQIQPRIDCLPCSPRIDEFTTNMAKAKKGYNSNEEFLRQLNRLRKILTLWFNRHYDFTIIDCPPTLSLQVQLLLGSADYYIIPAIPDRLSLKGSLSLLTRLKKRGYTRIQCLGTVWSLARKQIKNHNEIMVAVKKKQNEFAAIPTPFHTVIPNSAAITDAMDSRKEFAAFRDKYNDPARKIFLSLCKEIAERIIES